MSTPLWITSFDNQLATSLLTTCNRRVRRELSQAMRTHPDIILLITNLLQDVNVTDLLQLARFCVSSANITFQNAFENFLNSLVLCLDHHTVDELLQSLENGRLDGILVERYVAGAHYNRYKGLGMELGTLIKFPYNLGMQAPQYIDGVETCATFKKCVSHILNEGQIATVSL